MSEFAIPGGGGGGGKEGTYAWKKQAIDFVPDSSPHNSMLFSGTYYIANSYYIDTQGYMTLENPKSVSAPSGCEFDGRYGDYWSYNNWSSLNKIEKTTQAHPSDYNVDSVAIRRKLGDQTVVVDDDSQKYPQSGYDNGYLYNKLI